MTNYNNPGSNLNSSSTSNPYRVTFSDIHDNVNNYAIAYSGHNTPIVKADCSFNVAVVSNSSTQYQLALSLYGTTTFAQIQFFLALIGNEANGIIEAVTLSRNFLIFRLNP